MLGLLGDKKKIAQVILSEMPKKAPEEKEVTQGIEADFSMAHDALAKEIMEGVKNEDPGMVARSLKQFFRLCMKEDEYSVEEGE